MKLQEDQFQAKDYCQMNIMLYILNSRVKDSGESVCPGSYQCPAITHFYIILMDEDKPKHNNTHNKRKYSSKFDKETYFLRFES